MNKNIVLCLVLFICFLKLLSCKFEKNTVDPQSSNCINSSINDSLFIAAYTIETTSNSPIDVKECWVEYSWKNERSDSGFKKVKTSGVQLNLLVENFKRNYLDENKYFINWQMISEGIGVFGRGNGVYTLYGNNGQIPNVLKIKFMKILEDGAMGNCSDSVIIRRTHL